MPKLVRASKTQDKARLVLVESTKYNPIVTDPATSKLKTVVEQLEMSKKPLKPTNLKRIWLLIDARKVVTKNWSEYKPIL